MFSEQWQSEPITTAELVISKPTRQSQLIPGTNTTHWLNMGVAMYKMVTNF